MSTPRLLISRAGLTTQEVLADSFTIEQQSISNEILNGLNLTGISFNEVKISVCSFIKDDFSGNQFYSTEISNTLFTDCDFTNCELYDTAFINCIFTDCIFEKCEFNDCLFKACNLFKANMSWSYHASSRFIDSKMQHSFFESAIISNCYFFNVSFNNNSILGAKILKSEISNNTGIISEAHNVELILAGRE